MRISDWSSDVCSSDLRATSLPDFDQGADDVAHHVMQERIADDVDRDEFAHAAHVDATHFANRAWRLALRIAKCLTRLLGLLLRISRTGLCALHCATRKAETSSLPIRACAAACLASAVQGGAHVVP